MASLTGVVSQARADSGRIVLLEPGVSTPGARRCLTRVREELVAGGFDVVGVDPGPKMDPFSLADVMERQSAAVATIALLGDPEHGPSELWILDRVGGHTEVRRIAAPTDDPEHIPEVLAIRTIELLRASALKLLVEANRANSPPEPSPAPAAPRPVEARRSPPRTVAIETGLSVLESVGGPGPAALPIGRLRLALPGPLAIRLTVAGLGSRSRVETQLGSADITQALGLLELCARFRPGRRLQPLLSLGGGGLYVGIDGEALPPYQSNRTGEWEAVADGGLGVLATIGWDLSLALEIHALLVFPYPVVRFINQDAATVGRPALMASLTLVAWL